MKLISTVTVGAGGASSIDFTSIPNSYTDLVLVYSLRTNAAAQTDAMQLWFNGVSTSYSDRELQGNGSSPSASTGTNLIGYANGSTSTGSIFASGQVVIPNYAGSANKVVGAETVQEHNAAAATMDMVAGVWASTSAITSLSLKASNGTSTISQYSTASLYGITHA